MTTPRLAIAELAARQAQPHLPINAADRRLEQGATRFIILTATLSAPPGSPMDGDAHVVAATPAATGAWAGKEKHIAYYSGTGWMFIAPLLGFAAQIAGGTLFVYTAGSPAAWLAQAATGATTPTIRTYTGTSDTLLLADAQNIVESNNVAANTLTVPTNASAAFPIGSSIALSQIGAGQTTITPASGVTVYSYLGRMKMTGQYSGASLYKRAANEWVLVGDISA